MLRSLLLTTALLAGLVAPALAQTPAHPTPTPTPVPAPAHPATPPAAVPAKPTPPAVATPAKPTAAAPAPAAADSPLVHKVDINGASETELASLPGIGPVTAKNIVAGRPWDDLGALVSKKAMAQATFEKNKAMFALADINKSSVSDMAKTLPGIGDVHARKIVEGRPYAKPDDLVGKKILTATQFGKIKDLVTY